MHLQYKRKYIMLREMFEGTGFDLVSRVQITILYKYKQNKKNKYFVSYFITRQKYMYTFNLNCY